MAEQGTLFTTHEYDTLILAAIQGMEIDTDPETLDDVPDEIVEWVNFCEFIKAGVTILHLVLSGVLVPTIKCGTISEDAGYSYRKTENADVILENFGAGTP